MRHLGKHGIHLDSGGALQCSLVLFETADELEPYFNRLVACYRDVFSGEPYFKVYSDEAVESFVKPSM